MENVGELIKYVFRYIDFYYLAYSVSLSFIMCDLHQNIYEGIRNVAGGQGLLHFGVNARRSMFTLLSVNCQQLEKLQIKIFALKHLAQATLSTILNDVDTLLFCRKIRSSLFSW